MLPRPAEGDPARLPRLPNGKPDFSGLWDTGRHGYVTLGDAEVKVPLTPEYQKKRDWHRAETMAHRPPATSASRCESFGTPGMMSMTPIEMTMTADGGRLVMISQELRDVRRIYIDPARKHPDMGTWFPNFHGHSIAHWDGDVLVIDTVGTKGNLVGFDGIYLSEQAHIVERLRLANPDGMIDEITITDPLALKMPWRNSEYYKRTPKGTEVQEYVCTNNAEAGGPPPGK